VGVSKIDVWRKLRTHLGGLANFCDDGEVKLEISVFADPLSPRLHGISLPDAFAWVGSELEGIMRTALVASESTSRTFFASNKAKASRTLSASAKSISTTKSGVRT
jgi:hypothetical protein